MVAQLERRFIKERQREGIEQARVAQSALNDSMKALSVGLAYAGEALQSGLQTAPCMWVFSTIPSCIVPVLFFIMNYADVARLRG